MWNVCQRLIVYSRFYFNWFLFLTISLITPSFNFLCFNSIEYFSYLNMWLLYLWFLLMIMFLFIISSLLYHITLDFNDMLMEFFFSLFSIWFLLLIISPSLIILFNFNLILIVCFFIYCLGYQWAWSFNFSTILYFYFDSFIIIYYSYFYLFDFNRSVIFPLWSTFKLNIFSFDVIHCLGLYSFGIKIDGIPGRIHLASILRSIWAGEHKGFCFELCGQGHSSMLIAGIIIFGTLCLILNVRVHVLMLIKPVFWSFCSRLIAPRMILLVWLSVWIISRRLFRADCARNKGWIPEFWWSRTF